MVEVPGVEGLALVWLGCMGAAVGSFLNVVIYRLPAGLSLSYPGSHCPACKHPIRWYDNVPVLGWFMLRGRCRDCRTWISPRYPAVEALTALVFLAIGGGLFVTGGRMLPTRPVAIESGWLYRPLGHGEMVGAIAWHLVLVATLMAAAGIAIDRKPIPWRLYGAAWCVALAAPVFWPTLHPVPARAGIELLPGLVDTLAGLAAGAAIGLVPGRGGNRPLFMPLALVGAFLGWQAAVGIGLATLAVAGAARLLAAMTKVRPLPPVVWLTAITVLWILAWRPIADFFAVVLWGRA